MLAFSRAAALRGILGSTTTTTTPSTIAAAAAAGAQLNGVLARCISGTTGNAELDAKVVSVEVGAAGGHSSGITMGRVGLGGAASRDGWWWAPCLPGPPLSSEHGGDAAGTAAAAQAAVAHAGLLLLPA